MPNLMDEEQFHGVMQNCEYSGYSCSEPSAVVQITAYLKRLENCTSPGHPQTNRKME